jgi:hypothetical protein
MPLCLWLFRIADHSQAYITGNAFVVLENPTAPLQTVYDEDTSFLVAIAIDEATGKIATCTENAVRVYSPYGQDEGALKVCCSHPHLGATWIYLTQY